MTSACRPWFLSHRAVIVSCVALGVLVAAPIGSSAGPIIFSAAGPDAAAIQASVDVFRAAIGGANNGNIAGSQPDGRREINWDGGGAAALATILPSPMILFNSGTTTRGLVATTPGTGFEISGEPLPEFGDLNPGYPAIFKTFSSPRLFSPLGSTITDVSFFVPGTSTPAAVTAFGAVFTDVDLALSSIQLFNPDGNSLGVFSVPTFDSGLSFLGILSSDLISRVRITAGNVTLGTVDGTGFDVVVLDDFIYGEPQAVALEPVPEPGSLLLLGTGVAAVVRNVRRRARRS